MQPGCKCNPVSLTCSPLQKSRGQTVKYLATWDYLGISASSICAVHCVMTPALVLALPFYGLLLPYDELVHRVLAAVIVPVAALAAIPGFQRHQQGSVPAWIGAGVALIVFAAFGGGDALGGWWEEALTVLGSAALVRGHLLNRTFCRACPVCVADDRAEQAG